MSRTNSGLTCVGAAMLCFLSSASARAQGPTTTVSLTFDDTNASQLLALPSLDRHGFRGTFYVNSPRIGTGSYMSLAQLQQLAAAGHEIGGHTLDHPDLPTLSEAGQTEQICNDRTALLATGFDVRSFAYPRGAQNADTRRIVEQCGYQSGRLVGGLGCGSCRAAETVPPADPFGVRAPVSVRETQTLSGLIAMINRVRNEGGGWFVLTFHHFCDTTGIAGEPPMCKYLGINVNTFEALVDWIAAQPDVQVRTVNQVMQSAPPAPARPNLQTNTSFEQLGPSGMPSCWSSTGSGAYQATLGTSSEAFDGARSLEAAITGFLSGSVRTHPELKAQCWIPAGAGDCHRVGMKYQWFPADDLGELRFTLRRRVASTGGWLVQDTSQELYPATNGWGVVYYDADCAPADTSNIVVGLVMKGDGLLRADAMEVVHLNPAPPPPPPPPNLLVANPNFEGGVEANGAPHCWHPTGFGTYTATVTRSGFAYAGSYGLEANVTSALSGSALRVLPTHTDACSLPVAPGTCHRITAQVQWLPATTTSTVQFNARRKVESTGKWLSMDTGPKLPAASGWSQLSYDFPCVPDDTSQLAVGFYLKGTGILRVDDVTLTAR